MVQVKIKKDISKCRFDKSWLKQNVKHADSNGNLRKGGSSDTSTIACSKEL